mmetsp:Transcript_58132/g.168772  ORF Transcript_58132/g.168772 Transcript_58132/m.168772 type:complete len:277 (-) Transcript_58132:995-1825(-)
MVYATPHGKFPRLPAHTEGPAEKASMAVRLTKHEEPSEHDLSVAVGPLKHVGVVMVLAYIDRNPAVAILDQLPPERLLAAEWACHVRPRVDGEDRDVAQLRGQAVSPLLLVVGSDGGNRRVEVGPLGRDLPCAHAAHGAAGDIDAVVIDPLRGPKASHQLVDPWLRSLLPRPVTNGRDHDEALRGEVEPDRPLRLFLARATEEGPAAVAVEVEEKRPRTDLPRRCEVHRELQVVAPVVPGRVDEQARLLLGGREVEVPQPAPREDLVRRDALQAPI